MSSTTSRRSPCAWVTGWTVATSRTCPPLVEDVARLEPRYEKRPGWKAKTTGVTRYDQLPAAARDYVRFLEERVGAPAVFISTGPRREETIWRGDSAFLKSLPPEPSR